MVAVSFNFSVFFIAIRIQSAYGDQILRLLAHQHGFRKFPARETFLVLGNGLGMSVPEG